MEEKGIDLDRLKKIWTEQIGEEENYTSGRIFAMLKTKSSSSVRWIFIISLIELLVGVSFLIYAGFQMDFTHHHHRLISVFGDTWTFVYEGMNILVYVVTIYFIIQFFNHYRKIKVQSSVANLSKQIVNFRKQVNQYIWFNLAMFTLLFPFSVGLGKGDFVRGYIEGFQSSHGAGAEVAEPSVSLLILVSIVCFVLLLGLFLLYYRFVYGTFLSRLKENLKDLSA